MNSFKKIISKVLGVDEKEINDDSSPDTIENWDSFNSLLLVSELEDEFKIKFTIEDMLNIKTVKDIKKILIKYGVKLNT